MRVRPSCLAALAALLAVLACGCGSRAADPFKIAVFAFCDSRIDSLAFQQERADAGAELPFLRRGAKLEGRKPSAGISDISVGGRRAELLPRCAGFGNWRGDLDQLRQLVEQQGVGAVLLPVSVDVGVAVQQYVQQHPEVTFLLPTPFEQTPTLKHPGRNLFRFQTDGPQSSAGLGTYAYRTLGWRTAATLAADDPSDWSEVAGFVAEFCALGGKVVQRAWVPFGGPSYAATVKRIGPRKVDGLFFAGGVNGETTSVAKAWATRQPDLPHHLLVGIFSLFFDPAPSWLGVVGGSNVPYAPTPELTRYVADLKRLTGQNSFLLDTGYFIHTEALLEALEQVHGDTSHGERRLQQALARLHLDTPLGPVALDRRHQAIAPTYLGRLQRGARGKLVIKQIRVFRNVEQTFNGYFGPTTPPPSPTQPACHKGNVPAWAR